MNILAKIRQSLGLSDPNFDPEDETGALDASVTPIHQRDNQNHNNQNHDAHHSDNARTESGPDTPDDAPAAHLPQQLFDTVLEVFNDALPDFLKKSVDPEAQRQYLYDALSADMKAYLARVAADAEASCNNRWEQHRSSLQHQIDDLKQKSRRSDDETSEAKKQQLSAERQKRALNERVRDLEQQLANAQAEMEQKELEVKAMVNKLRLADMGVAADASADEALLNEIQAQKDLVAKAEQQLSTVQAQLQTRTEELEAKEQQSIQLAKKADDLEQQADHLRAEMVKLQEALECQQAKDDLGNAMISDFNAKTAEAREEAREARAQLDNLREDLNAANEELERVRRENSALNADLQQAIESMEVLEQMSQQLTSLEEKRKANDEFLRKQREEMAVNEQRNAQLEEELQKAKNAATEYEEQVRQLNQTIDSLRKTIENNVYEHSQAESALRYEIDRLKALQTSAQESTGSAPRAETHPIPMADDMLEDTDWMVSAPTKRSRARRNADDDPDFGYKEPERRQYPDNANQLSLF